jgi:hypothetical protein
MHVSFPFKRASVESRPARERQRGRRLFEVKMVARPSRERNENFGLPQR